MISETGLLLSVGPFRNRRASLSLGVHADCSCPVRGHPAGGGHRLSPRPPERRRPEKLLQPVGVSRAKDLGWPTRRRLGMQLCGCAVASHPTQSMYARSFSASPSIGMRESSQEATSVCGTSRAWLDDRAESGPNWSIRHCRTGSIPERGRRRTLATPDRPCLLQGIGARPRISASPGRGRGPAAVRDRGRVLGRGAR
jgi:hypothetical protein